METLSLEITGMRCGHCVGAVRRALESMDGVVVEQVRVGSAEVRFDPAAQPPAAIAAAVDAAGYGATPARSAA